MNTVPLPDLTGAPALTLLNPWPAAIAHWSKRVENRTWAPAYRGWFLLHAGKGWGYGGWWSFCRDLGIDFMTDEGAALIVPSAVVAVAELVDVCTASADDRSCRCGPWAMPGHYHWQLDQVLTLPDPIPANGRQRLWRPGPELLAAVTAQVQDINGVELVCNGRDDDGRGQLCGTRFTGRPGETRWLIEQRARVRGWRLGPAGPRRHIMCSACAKPDPELTRNLTPKKGN